MEGLKELTAGRNISEAVTDMKRERRRDEQFDWQLQVSACQDLLHVSYEETPYSLPKIA